MPPEMSFASTAGESRVPKADPQNDSGWVAVDRYDIVALVSNDLVTDQRMQRTLTSLSDRGYRCLLVGRQRSTSTALDEGFPFAQYRHRLPHDRGKRFYIELNRAHYRYLLRLKPRAILAVDLDTVAAAALASRRLKVPFVFDAHELFEEMPEVARRPWIRATWLVWGRIWVPSAARAYTVGEQIAQILSRRYGLSFGVVRNFPFWRKPVAEGSPERERNWEWQNETSPRPFTILYQGALNEGRGIEELIAAVAQMPNVRAWIAGDGPESARLQAFAKTFPAADVRFFGELSPAALRELTPRADLGYALMRNESLNYRLSLSNESVDYVHAGLPSLQMDWPEYRALQEQFGCFELVAELTVAAVVAAVASCRDPKHYERLRSRCLIAAPQLTWEAESAYVLEVFSELLDRSDAESLTG